MMLCKFSVMKCLQQNTRIDIYNSFSSYFIAFFLFCDVQHPYLFTAHITGRLSAA